MSSACGADIIVELQEIDMLMPVRSPSFFQHHSLHSKPTFLPFSKTTNTQMSAAVGHDADMEIKGHQAQIKDAYDSDEKTRAADMRADAIDAENAEHKLGVISAIKGYPMAATWAFIISCTIVSPVFSSSSARKHG